MFRLSDWASYFVPEILTDRSVKKVEYQEYKPNGGPSEANYNQSTVTFDIARGGADSFMIPEQGYLSCKYEIQKDNGIRYTATDNIALMNGASIFQRIDCSFNNDGAITGSPNEAPAEYQLLNSLLQLTRASDSERSAQYQFLDTINGGAPDLNDGTDLEENLAEGRIRSMAFGDDDVLTGVNLDKDKIIATLQKIYDEIEPDNINLGQVARLRACKPDKENTIRIPLSSIHPFFTARKAMRGVSINLVFHRQTVTNKIFLAGEGLDVDGGLHLHIKNLSIVIPFVTPSPSVFNSINKELTSKQSFMYPFRSVQTFTQMLTDGVIDIPFNTKGKYVTSVFIGFRGCCRYRSVGHITNLLWRNKLIFDLPKRVSGFYCEFDGQHFPALGYDSTRQPGYLPAYEEFLKMAGGGIQAMDYPASIDYKQWREVYPIFAFDLSNTDTAMITTSNGVLRVKANLDLADTALAVDANNPNFQMVVWVVTDEYIEMKEENAMLKSVAVGEPLFQLPSS